MTDYSQAGEQLAIVEATKNRTLAYAVEYLIGGGTRAIEPPLPRFLDIGAWHPKEFSNTRALFENGWAGVMIEPSPRPMLNLIEEYGNEPRITLVQAAVGCEPGMVCMAITDDAVSTSSAAVYGQWKDAAKYLGKMLVPVITWEQIKLRWEGFQFVNIDAEGQSADLFMQMLQQEYFPPCCCVEHDSRTTELLKAATAAGYRAVLVNDTNLVTVRP